MLAGDLVHFLRDTLADPSARWSESALEHVARLHVPEAILSGRTSLLRADLHTLWAQWFLESICDLEMFAQRNVGYAIIVQEVTRRVRVLLGQVPERDHLALTSAISQLLDREIRRRRDRHRSPIDKDQRTQLWEQNSDNPRCWVCGHRFAGWAVDQFLGVESPRDIKLPEYVDFAKPSGIRKRDLSIEVDHVVPVARGGTNSDNLRLICGWCNGVKGARQSLYDVDGIPSLFHHPQLGQMTIPRSFWVIRLLVTHPRCEWSGAGGCDQTSKNAELTVCSWHAVGSMNPANLRVTCAEHHPLGHERLVAREWLLAQR